MRREFVQSFGWQSLVTGPIATPEDAVQLIARLGFCTWGPISGLAFPNLAEAMGESASSVLLPTWFWKDDLHFAQQLYYGKIVNGQPSFIAPDYLPDFIAAFSASERDPLHLYLDGRLSRAAKSIYDYIADHPEQSTRELRRGLSLGDKSAKTTTENALRELQRRFLLCKVDLTGRTRGTYCYIWDMAERFWPAAFEQARQRDMQHSRERIRAKLQQAGIESSSRLEEKLFLWRS